MRRSIDSLQAGKSWRARRGVHDPAYLVEDARHAVAAGARHGVRMACLVSGPDGRSDASTIFGARAALQVDTLDELPGALRRLLG